MHRPGVEPAISRSQVQRRNHYTTEQPNVVFLTLNYNVAYNLPTGVVTEWKTDEGGEQSTTRDPDVEGSGDDDDDDEGPNEVDDDVEVETATPKAMAQLLDESDLENPGCVNELGKCTVTVPPSVTSVFSSPTSRSRTTSSHQLENATTATVSSSAMPDGTSSGPHAPSVPAISSSSIEVAVENHLYSPRTILGLKIKINLDTIIRPTIMAKHNTDIKVQVHKRQ